MEDNRIYSERPEPMRRLLLIISLIFIIISPLAGESIRINQLLKITPEEGDPYRWPYYLYIPDLNDSDSATLLILPNNTGKCSDDFDYHDKRALRQIYNMRDFADALRTIIIMPVFPRPETDWQIYTHALDRDALLTSIPELKRLDLQLIGMIDHSKKMLNDMSITVRDQVLMFGHSAAGMFVNRFCILHPELIRAAAIGSPGGWPMAPLEQWKNQTLRYPIGTADIREITGISFDAETFAEIPMLFFLGDQDDNDAVAYDDAYDSIDREIIMKLFGQTPVERWPVIGEIYRDKCHKCEFKMYEGVGHEVNSEMWKDIKAFFRKYLP